MHLHSQKYNYMQLLKMKNAYLLTIYKHNYYTYCYNIDFYFFIRSRRPKQQHAISIVSHPVQYNYIR